MATIVRDIAPPAGRRLAAAVVDAREVARRLDEAARAEASRIVSAAHAEAESVLREAARRGREEGLASVTELRARAIVARDAWLVAAQAEVLELALEVARRVVGDAAERDPAVALRSVARALERARARGALTLRVNPRDHGPVLAAEPRPFSGDVVRLVADPEVERGCAIVESEGGRVVACLESQVAALGRALSGET
jgi:flagellar biosynthesis/type III secretory pathway protein FliH